MSPFISPDLLERLGASLVHFLWQGGVVALALAVIRRFMDKPKVQYAASLGALLVLSCCPVVVRWSLPSHPADDQVVHRCTSALPSFGNEPLELVPRWLPGLAQSGAGR